MDDFVVQSDPIQCERRSRTVHVHGRPTQIRLENLAWDILREMAEAQNTTTNALVVVLHDEVLENRAEGTNFTSFLRVTCMRYLQHNLIAGAGVSADEMAATAATTTATTTATTPATAAAALSAASLPKLVAVRSMDPLEKDNVDINETIPLT